MSMFLQSRIPSPTLLSCNSFLKNYGTSPFYPAFLCIVISPCSRLEEDTSVILLENFAWNSGPKWQQHQSDVRICCEGVCDDETAPVVCRELFPSVSIPQKSWFQALTWPPFIERHNRSPLCLLKSCNSHLLSCC